MVEGGGLLNRYMVNIRIGGSNPPPSATLRLRMDSLAQQVRRMGEAQVVKPQPLETAPEADLCTGSLNGGEAKMYASPATAVTSHSKAETLPSDADIPV